ncbi:Alpha/Beta hydrolase protein [Pisolithus orientalis]|uniref:Alpha/Beta hydrolase protein n=1 Tax=Pisolithus orientalis TaxID=936130 RepID=UPI00222561CA|nr:Alpha/Beta hydrolase protein [Pisolithus orientalis]KAI6002310.1 Alpha/Beta hydrolase protein [Pisolithus orientalis]
MACAGSSKTPSRPRTREIIDPTILGPCVQLTLCLRPTAQLLNPSDVKLSRTGPQTFTGSDNGLPPILIFLYGGGLVHGARSSSPANLVHNDPCAFFASILVVIPDYRPAPEITFPRGSEDTIGSVAEGDSNRVFLLGHSAGGLHLASYLLLPSLFLSSSAFGCVAVNHPLSLLRRADDSHILSLPPTRNVMAGSETRTISVSIQTSAREFKSRGSTIAEFVLEGHKHLSPILALSSGSGEDWGHNIVRWIIG